MTSWNGFRFGRYDAKELEACGSRFLAEVQRVGTSEREQLVLDWFAASAPVGMLVNARAGQGRWRSRAHGTGEWMVDLAHSNYALADNRDYWPRVLSGSLPCTIRLALEVSWGTHNEVLDAASKVAAIRSDAKAVVSSVGARTAPELFRDLGRLRTLTNDVAPWLCIDLDDAEPSCRVLS